MRGTGTILLGLALLLAGRAMAQDAWQGAGQHTASNNTAELQAAAWEARLSELESELALLRAMTAEESPAFTVSPPPAPTRYPNARLTGFFQADYGWISQDPLNKATVGDAENGADFRRARLAAVGHVAPNVAYSLEMDFAFPGHPSFMDVWLEVQELPTAGNIRVGHFRQPVSMTALTSVRELTFLERPLPFAFVPFRQMGVMASDQEYDGMMTWAVSGFRFPTDFYGAAIGDNSGGGLAARLTALPIYCEGAYLLHVGGSFSTIHAYNDRFQYRSTPEFATLETGGGVPGGVAASFPFFVDTGLLNADTSNIYGGELAFEIGSFYFQSEILFANVDQVAGPQANFSGGYAQAAYLLTGETRPYNQSTGAFGRVKPRCAFGQGGYGALEAAVRYSYIDLTDDNVTGGRLDDITAGLNWYLNENTKFQINYIHAFLDPAGAPESDADIVGMRAQVDF